MYCSKCGKEIDDDSKFCEHCGNNVTEIKAKHNLTINSKVIIVTLFIIIGIIMIFIGFNIFKNNDSNNTITFNSNNTSNESTRIEDLVVQEHNGYKTFNFTIDDVIRAYYIKEEKVIFDKDGAYCQAHSGTTRAIFFPDNRILTEQEKYMSEIHIIYEDKSRKVISINTPLMGIQLVAFLTDNNMELTDNWAEGAKNHLYEYMILLLNRVNRQFKNIDVLGDATNSKYIYSSADIICGRYKMIEKNIGLAQCITEKPIDFYLVIRATDEDEFYNSTINSLLDVSVTNMHLDKLENNTSTNYENNNTNISGTYTDRIAVINSEGLEYGHSYNVYTFKSGTVEFNEEFITYKGTYTIKDNKITITYTGAYDIENPITLDKFNDELTIKDENTLVTSNGIEYLKE